MNWVRSVSLGAIFLLACQLTSLYGQRLDWHLIDENQAQFGFVGYKGGRKNVAVDREGNIISCAPFGNRVYAGAQEWNAGFETLIVKRASNGQVIWSRTLNGNGFKYGHSIQVDSIGNIYILGWFYGNSTINGASLPVYGNYDCFLVKLNSAGNFVYTKTFGGAGYDYPMALTVDSRGQVWVCGKFSFSMQLQNLNLSGAANSHFLFMINSNGTPAYLKQICQNGSGDWGLGDLSLGPDGKLIMVSNYGSPSAFQSKNLSGSGGYLAQINPHTGDVDSVIKSGSQTWLVDHEPGGNLIVLGMQSQAGDSIGASCLPALQGSNQLFLARLGRQLNPLQVRVIPKLAGNYVSSESIRQLHISQSGQIFLSGELESACISSPGDTLKLNLPHQTGRPQAVLFKYDEDFTCAWYAGVGSRDTLQVPNINSGCGLGSDLEGNVVWCTMNDANSVGITELILNNDTFVSGSLSSRYAAHGIHYWKLNEPSVETKMPFIRSYCPGDSLFVEFSTFGTFGAGNRFRLELSDTSGGFVQPQILELRTDSSSLDFRTIIPFATTPSPNYRLRVVGTVPIVYGSITPLSIEVRGKPDANAGPDRLFCLGDTVQLEASGGGSYQWTGQGILSNPDSQAIEVWPDDHRAYFVRVTDSVSSCYNLDTLQLSYHEKLELEPLSDTLLCVGQSLLLRATVANGNDGELHCHWTDAQGNLLSLADSLLLMAGQPDTLTLEAGDACSVEGDTERVVVRLRPALSIQPPSDTLVCSGVNMQVRGQTSGGLPQAYHWEWTDSLSGALHSAQEALQGTFVQSTTLKLKLTDGCTANADSAWYRIRVATGPELLHLDSALLCEGDSAWLRSEVQGGFDPVYEYSWNGGSWSTDSARWVVAYTNELVRLKVRDRCGMEDSATSALGVRPDRIALLRPDTLVCRGEQYLLYVRGIDEDSVRYSAYWDDSPQAAFLTWRQDTQSAWHRLRMVDHCRNESWNDSVWIAVRPALHLDVPADTLYCDGEWVKLIALASGGNPETYQIEWKEGQNLLGNTDSLVFQVNHPYTLQVSLKDQCTQPGDALSLEIRKREPLFIQPQADTLLCYGQVFRANPQFSGGNGFYRLQVDPGDSADWYQGMPVYQDTRISYTLSDACSRPYAMDFLLQVRPPLELKVLADTAYCIDTTVPVLADLQGGIPGSYSLQWNTGSDRSEIMLNLSGDTLIWAELSDGCSVPARDSLFIHAIVPPPAQFSLTDSGWCAPGFLLARAEPHPGIAGYHWVWERSFSDSLAEGAEFGVVDLEKGNYHLSLQVTDAWGCTSKSVGREIAIFPSPIADFVLSDTLIDLGEQAQIRLLSNSFVSEIWWPSGIENSGNGEYSYSPADTGLWVLVRKAENQWGCTSYDTARLWVKEPFVCWIPTAFYPWSGMEENRYWTALCPDISVMEIRIYNRWGQLIHWQEGSAVRWDGSMPGGQPAPSGVYLYLLRVENHYGEKLEFRGTVSVIR